jgi:hypothetical protein
MLVRRIVVRRAVVACGLAFASLSACSQPEERSDVGYSDGYAVGYNTECQIRATLVEGDFKNEAYAKAYRAGLLEGASACRADRAQKDEGPPP